MPLSQTPALQIDLMAEGDNNKYLLFNDAIQSLEDSFHKELAVDLTSGNHTLIESELVNNGVMVCSGHAVARDLTVPTTVGSPPVATSRIFFVKNEGTGAGAVTVTHGSGDTVLVAIGETAIIRADGTNIALLGAVSSGGSIDTLSDVDTSTTAPDDLQVLTWINGTGNWEPRNPNSFAINDQTGTTYTLVLADKGALVRLDNAAAITLTVPTNASVAFPIGTQIVLRQVAAGEVTIAGGGVTFNSPDDLIFGTAGETGILIKTATDTWDVIKDITGAGASTLGVNNQTGTSYTLVLTDVDKVVRCANASPFALTVPTNASEAFAIGSVVRIAETGAGTVTVDGPGVTLNALDDLIMGTQHEQLVLIKVATDEWDVVKDANITPTTGINTQTGTTYTLALPDAEGIVEMNNGAANVLTIPTNASVAYDIGTIMSITQFGAGVTTVTGDTGVTVNGVSAGGAAINNRYEGVSIYKRGTNEWIMQGSHGTVA